MKSTKSTTRQTGVESFLGLTAADLMKTAVMTIPHETSLREAARLLAGSHVSGAPVVDADGRCLGMLSSSDFVAWAGEEESAAGGDVKATCFIAPWGEMINIEESAENEIHQYMRAPVISVAPTTPLAEMAQKMADSHIHRLLVVGERERLCGIVSSTDILAAIGQATQGSTHHGPHR